MGFISLYFKMFVYERILNGKCCINLFILVAIIITFNKNKTKKQKQTITTNAKRIDIENGNSHKTIMTCVNEIVYKRGIATKEEEGDEATHIIIP